MKKLRFFAEYLAPPFFDPSIEDMGHIESKDLPISTNLLNDIEKWDREYQDTFNDDYPPDSGFATLAAELDFKCRGAVLAERLNEELSDVFQIEYR